MSDIAETIARVRSWATSDDSDDDTDFLVKAAPALADECERLRERNAWLEPHVKMLARAADVERDEKQRLRERVRVLEEALTACDEALTCDPVFDVDHWCVRCDDSVDRNGEARKLARAALKGGE